MWRAQIEAFASAGCAACGALSGPSVDRGPLLPGELRVAACQDLSETNLPAGHWLPLERKAEVAEAIRSFIKTKTRS